MLHKAYFDGKIFLKSLIESYFKQETLATEKYLTFSITPTSTLNIDSYNIYSGCSYIYLNYKKIYR